MTTAGWYYTDGSVRLGPMEANEIYRLIGERAIGPKTLVWRQGMGDWQAATDHFDFAHDKDEAGPPPIPPTPPRPPGEKGGGERHAFATTATGSMTGPDGLYIHAPSRGFGDAISVCFQKYFTFSGRASRSEFWFFSLFWLLMMVVTVVLDALLFGIDFTRSDVVVSPLNSLSTLALLFPTHTVGWRRLHDTNRSGWWIGGFYLALVPIIVLIAAAVSTAGSIAAMVPLVVLGILIYMTVLTVFMVLRGDPGPNRYG